jgi:TrmH family RNA methyltransferase
MMNKPALSAENAEYQIIRALKLNRQQRNRRGEVFVEGIECVKQAVAAGAGVEITRIITKNAGELSDWGKGLIKKQGRAKIVEMTEPLYRGLCDRAEPSELLITARVRAWRPEDVNAEKPVVIVFDRPGDCGNLGSAIRSANAFGIDGVFILGHGVDPYESKTIRASLGSVFSTKIIPVDSLETLRAYIKNQKARNGMTVLGTDSSGPARLQDETLKAPVMVILGNEARGMSVKLRELCDRIVRIPITGAVNSLNVSCAASILLWEIFRAPPSPGRRI